MKLGQLAFVAALIAGRIHAASSDPLWTAAVELAAKSRDMVAGSVVTRTEIRDGGGEMLEIVSEKDHLTGWRGREPQRRKESSHKVVRKSGLSIEIRVRADSNVFLSSSEGRVTSKFMRDETLDGQNCAVYQYEERPAPGSKEKDIYYGQVWIDRANATPVQVTYTIKPLPNHVSSFTMTIRYQPQSGQRFAIVRSVTTFAGGNLFFKRRVHVEKEFSDWTLPPAK